MDKMSAEDRIRTGELLREQILSLSPLTRLGNFGLVRPHGEDGNKDLYGGQKPPSGMVRTSPLPSPM